MNVADFLAAFRADLQDEEQPYLWSDQELVRYLNAAVQEANERALLTEDRSTTAVCVIPLQAGVATYALHPSVLQVKRVTLRGRPLDETSIESLDREYRNWESHTGHPRRFIFEQASGSMPPQLRLVSTPVAADVLNLTVYRGALKPLCEDRDTEKPELPVRFHEQLKDWVYRCAYLKQDAETLDKAKAADFEAIFVGNFGQRPDANVQRKQRDRRSPIVRFTW